MAMDMEAEAMEYREPEMDGGGGGAMYEADEEEVEEISDSLSPEHDSGAAYDFMGYVDELDFRQYLHQMREDFNPSSAVRIDFTETVAFVAGTKLQPSLGRTVQLQVPNFHLAEQITQFVVKVDLYSSKGRYGFGSKTLKSSVPVFAKFSTPTSMIVSDVLSIPVTIYNSLTEQVTIEYAVIDREVSGNDASVLSTKNGQQTIEAGGSVQFEHVLDSS